VVQQEHSQDKDFTQNSLEIQQAPVRI